MLKTVEQFNKFIKGARRKNLDVVFYKGYRELNIRNNEREYWFRIPISDEIHNYLAQKCNYRYHIVMHLEKDNKVFFIPRRLDCTYRDSCENCDLINHCKFLELFTVVNKKLDKNKNF